jgi:hypothetical protein
MGICIINILIIPLQIWSKYAADWTALNKWQKDDYTWQVKLHNQSLPSGMNSYQSSEGTEKSCNKLRLIT